MFTGIIEKLARVAAADAKSISLADPFGDEDLKTGDSVAVNGVCLTVSGLGKALLRFDVSPETFSRTNLGKLKKGGYVNAERALKAGSRISGHFVSGHVDCTGFFAGREKNGASFVFSFSVPDGRLLAEKGSVAVDGISLTCYGVNGGRFKASVIPHTYENTNLKFLKKGAPVNVEFDLLAKYAVKKISPITTAFLSENGWV